jgi:hypothetical protein
VHITSVGPTGKQLLGRAWALPCRKIKKEPSQRVPRVTDQLSHRQSVCHGKNRRKTLLIDSLGPPGAGAHKSPSHLTLPAFIPFLPAKPAQPQNLFTLILFPPLSATENSRKCYTAAASPWKTALPFCGMAHMGCTVDLLSIIGNPCPMLFMALRRTAKQGK